MPTASERMLELSPLAPGATARSHFLAITLGGGSGFTVVEGVQLEMDMAPEIEIDEGLDVSLENESVDIEIDDSTEIIIEDC
jgi:hypothetical protein